jgi:peptidoglycan-associated lipoprotein
MLIRYIVPCMALIAAPAFAAAPSESDSKESAAPPTSQPTSGCGLVRVHFDTDSSELGPAEKAKLDTTAACLKAKERLRVTVVGNADERGSEDYNLALGHRRADAVAAYLEGRGVSSQQLVTESHGEDRPICEQDNPECWQQNRRTTMRDACRL